MKQHWRIGLLALVVLSLFIWFRPQHKAEGPVHKGKPISYWVDRACQNPSQYKADIRVIGGPAVPYLIAKLQTVESPLRNSLSHYREQLPPWLQRCTPEIESPTMTRWHAAWVLSWLGPEARPAVPELARQVSDPNRAELSMAWALRAIGPAASNAIPALHAALTNQSPHLRVEAAWAIWSIAGDTNLVMQVCTNAIATHQGDIGAMWVLYDMGPAALQSESLVLGTLQNQENSERLRSTAAAALGKITDKTPQTITALMAGLEDQMPLVRMYSGFALWKMDVQYVPVAAPKIIEALVAMDPQYGEASDNFVELVEGYGLDVKPSIPFLNQLLTSGSPKVAQAALAALQKAQTNQSPVLTTK